MLRIPTSSQGFIGAALGFCMGLPGPLSSMATDSDSAVITVTAMGMGESIEQARTELILDGLRRAASTYTKGKEVTTADDFEENFATFSDAIVKSVRYDGSPEKVNYGSHTLWRVSGNVDVVRRNLIDSLGEFELELNGLVKSDDLLARAVSLNQLQKESTNLLRLLFDDDPRRFRANFSGLTPVPIQALSAEEAQAGLNWFTVRAQILPDLQLYRNEIGPRLLTVLNAITHSRMRVSHSFENRRSISGYVWPSVNSRFGIRALMDKGFSECEFAGGTADWMPKSTQTHVYRELFLGEEMVFARGFRQLPVFSSEVSWYVGSHQGPYTGYNVNIVLPDQNGYPLLNQYVVAPAFFQPFAEVLAQNSSSGSGSHSDPLIVTLKLLDEYDQEVKTFQHPLPLGPWVSPYVWAGASKSRRDPDSVFVMPLGMNPRVCGSIFVERVQAGAYQRENKSVVNSFTTIASATVTFKFPLQESDLRRLSRIRILVDK